MCRATCVLDGREIRAQVVGVRFTFYLDFFVEKLAVKAKYDRIAVELIDICSF